MLQKKVCMLGAFAVGKTSLVRRFVTSMFSDRYHTTVGVKIDRKIMRVGPQEISLILWDIHGEDAFQQVNMSYLRGAAAYILVVDGTRSATLGTAVSLQERAQEVVGDVPFVVILNKVDLQDDWELEQPAVDGLAARQWSLLTASAKTGTGVDRVFEVLVHRMLDR